MINDCTLSVFIAFVLFGGSIATSTVPQEQHDKLTQTFSKQLADTYANIVKERSLHYLQGLLLGIVLATFVTYYMWPERRSYQISSFIAITLFTALFYYRLRPKSDYMINHLKTQEQNQAWLNIYKSYQSRYLYGMILGALASFFVARGICNL